MMCTQSGVAHPTGPCVPLEIASREMDIVILPGDGIGAEISAAMLDVLKAADGVFGLGLVFETRDMGLKTLKEQGTTLPPDILDRVRRSDGAVLGPVSHYDYPPREQGGLNPSAEFRVKLDLYANIRPCRSRPGLSLAPTPMDLVIVRECTEGFYSDRNMFAGSGEFMPTPDMVLSVRKITAHGSRRIARAAFELARKRRRKVTAVHKANVMKMSDGLFLREVRKVAEAYPDVQLEDLIVDATAALLIRDPSRFDVIVTTNMFGDILSDEASELSRQPRPRRRHQCQRDDVRGAGPARLGAGHPGPGPRQPDVADPVGGDAARLAGGAARPAGIRRGGAGDRRCDRPGNRRPEPPHRRPRRQAWDTRLWRDDHGSGPRNEAAVERGGLTIKKDPGPCARPRAEKVPSHSAHYL